MAVFFCLIYCVNDFLFDFLRRLRSPEILDGNETSMFRRPLRLLEENVSRPDSILGDPGTVSGSGKKSKRARKKFGRRKFKNDELFSSFDFPSPEFFSRPFRLFPAPTNCPWVSEDGRTHNLGAPGAR